MGVGFWQNSTHSIQSKVWTFKLRAAPRWPLRDHQKGANCAKETNSVSKDKCVIQGLTLQGLKMATFARNPRVMHSPGEVYLFDFRSPGEGAALVACDNFPDYGTEKFGPHCISAVEHEGAYLSVGCGSQVQEEASNIRLVPLLV